MGFWTADNVPSLAGTQISACVSGVSRHQVHWRKYLNGAELHAVGSYMLGSSK